MSTLKVGTIQDHANSNTAITIDNAGHVAMPNTKRGIFQVYSNSSQSIGSNATTLVQLDQKVFDPDNYFNTTNYRYIPQIAGYYVIEGQIMWEADAGDNCYLSAYIFKNGSHSHSTGASPYISGTGTVKPMGIAGLIMGTSNEQYVRTSSLVYFNGSSDYVDLRGYIYNYTDSGATDNLMKGHADNMLTWMYGYRID
jgi:hypothetical protein